MGGVIRKQVSRDPSLADYLADPERYPTVAGRPYPNVDPRPMTASPGSLPQIFAPQDDQFVSGGDVSLADPRLRTMAFGALAREGQSLPPSQPFTPPPLPPQRGMEPLSAPQGPPSSLPEMSVEDAEWRAALDRARASIRRETDQATDRHRLEGMSAEQMHRQRFGPLARALPTGEQFQGAIAGLGRNILHSGPARWIREHSDPMVVSPRLREEDRIAAARQRQAR